jgi:hypothetical protein
MNTRCLAALSVFALSMTAAAQPMYGIMFRTGGQTSGLNPKLYDVNPITGAATNPRNVNVNDCVGIAVDPSTGVMYGLTDQFGRINNLSGQGGKGLIFTINPTTGAATSVGRTDPTGVFQVLEGDIAFNPVDGSFWGVSTLINSARLFTINKATGLATQGALIVPPNDGPDLDISALAFDRSGRLFVLDTRYPSHPGQAILIHIDPTTGTALEQWDTGVSLGNVAGMTFGPDGILYVADGDTSGTNHLYRFSFVSNSLVDIGATGAAGGIYQGLAGIVYPCGVARATSMPSNAAVGCTDSVSFNFAASGNGLAYSWQWTTDSQTWNTFTNGSLPFSGGTIAVSGATTTHLTLALNVNGTVSSVQLRCVAANTCSTVTSDAATLTISSCSPPCPADFNQDGGVDGADVSAFFGAWEAGDTSADVNADGGVDGGDVSTFFVAWEAGGC